MNLFIFMKNSIGRFFKDRAQIDARSPMSDAGKAEQD
jgi:hypothetical protein